MDNLTLIEEANRQISTGHCLFPDMNAHLIRMIQLALVDRSTSAAHRDLLARLRQRLEGFQQERPQA